MTMSMNLKDYVKIYDVLTHEECQKTIQQLDNVNWEPHKFYQANIDKLNVYSNNFLISNDDFQMCEVITEKIAKLISKYIFEDHIEFRPWFSGWNGCKVPRFNKYPINSRMKIHCDHIHSMFDGQRKGVPVLSVLGALNDDYEGGEFVMWGDTVIELKAGQIMIFPSNFMYPHEVKMITKGTRYSYISWVW